MTRRTLWSSVTGDIPANLAFVNNFDATTNPGVGDDSADGYSRGSVWVNTATDIPYLCTDATAGAAVWVPLSEGSSTPGQIEAPDATTPTGNGGNASITGGSGGTTSGNGGNASLVGGTGTAGNGNGGSAIVSGGAPHGTGVEGSVRELGLVMREQGAPAAVNATATLTAAQLIGGIITSTTAAATNATLPAATAMDTAIPDSAANDSLDFSVINTGPEAFTILTGAGWTALVGAVIVATATSGRFRARKTAAGAWTLYRLA